MSDLVQVRGALTGIHDGRSHCAHHRDVWVRPPLKPPSQRAVAARRRLALRLVYPMSDLRDLYQEVILDHSKKPRNFRELPEANHRADGYNPLCGDRATVFVRLDGDA